jgi:hypothetical protein
MSLSPLARCALVALALAALALGVARAQAPARTYLPLVSQPAGPPAAVRFGTGLAGGELTGPGTTFGPGLTALYYEVTVADAVGQPFRLEWTVAGARRPELDRVGALPADGGPLAGAIALSTSAPLPQGPYLLRVYVGGLNSGSGQATIQ